MRHTVARTLLSGGQTDGDVSLEKVPVALTGSAYSLSGMAAIGGFGVAPVGPSASTAPDDTSSRQSSLKQRRRSGSVIRAPIASAEELSPASPQGFSPSGPEDRGIRQLPVDTRYVNSRVSDTEPCRDQVTSAAKMKTSRADTFADDSQSDNDAVSLAVHTKPPSYNTASRLGMTFAPAVSGQSVDSSLPTSLPSVPGAVRRPDSFALAMSDQLLVASEPRRGRSARSPTLETQPEEELSGIFEYSV